ncbi:MAG: single-stranded-DNA-specific exonuclease RecJ [Methylococcales bacterium]|nr:single-stranded-DNA-specific exonuclease RecJ [Methylococcales bacterium]
MKKKIIRRPILNKCLNQSIPNVLDRIYRARQINNSSQLDYSLKQLLPFSLLNGIDKAVDLLYQALLSQKRVMIVADFDTDGATSCALAVKALTKFGLKQVEFLVPNRFEYGYGLTPEIVELAKQSSPELLITVDNGISSIDGVLTAKQAGMEVLITDHHLPGNSLPEADAIVNPNCHGDNFPSKSLAGVGVIFYVLLALRAKCREMEWFQSQALVEPNMADFLDLVALGTVADVVVLDQNNRILVDQGLKRINHGHCCLGIKALIDVAGKSIQRLSATDLGFSVAPRLNAAGRLDDMSLGIACLLSNEKNEAKNLAEQLHLLNQERREIEASMQDEAMIVIKKLENNQQKHLPFGICLFDETWHQGVIGILASRIKEKYNRPAVIFAAHDNKTLKGSCRSVKGFHIRDGLDAIATKNPGLIEKFGGHAMAAGLSIDKANLTQFSELFDLEVQQFLDEQALQGVIESDGELAADELNLNVASLIKNAGPWGQGFPEPVFDGIFDIIEKRVVGKKHLKMRLQPASSQIAIDAIAFNVSNEQLDCQSNKATIAYRLDINEFRGAVTPQLIVEYLEM